MNETLIVTGGLLCAVGIVFHGLFDETRSTMDANGTHLTQIVADQPGGVSDWGSSP